MCGIAGIFNYASPDQPVDRALLERMTRALAHRGPDGEGFHLDGPVGLGHRRLAVVDLTETGAQPMANEDGSLWITYNGELYDHAAQRRALGSGHRFRGSSDTETLLHLLEARGPEVLEGLSAIFAFGLWDARRRMLTLARDPLGVKQLYYHDDGERLLFASEVKSLLVAPGVPCEVDPEAVNQYLHFHVPLFGRTFFKGIRQLRAGEYLEVALGGRSVRRRYWRIERFGDRRGTPAQAVEELRALLGRVVEDQLMSDVPVGAFFSGGIDSSAVAEHARRAGGSPRCFGVHFSGQGVVDERPYQEAAARALGLELDLLTLDGSTFAEDLARLLWHQDEPVVGAALLPMYHVSRLASRSVKVCIGGQAGDEIFGGYARYALAHPLRAAAAVLARRRGPGGTAPGEAQVGGNLARQLGDRRVLGRLVRSARRALDWPKLSFQNFPHVPEAFWKELFAAEGLVSRESCRHTFREELLACPAPDPAAKVMYWDLEAYLPGLFQQDDRMSMASGLESRVPLADPRLVRFAFELPSSLKVRAGATKWILRQAVADVLPPQVLTRRKVGFDTPAELWMRERHAGFVRETLLSARARHRGLWNPRALERWLDDPRRRLWFEVVWKALCIETWACLFLDAARPRVEGPVEVRPGSPAEEQPPAPEPVRLRDRVRELRELGPRGLAFRVRWELQLRTGLTAALERPPPPLARPEEQAARMREGVFFAEPAEVAAAVRGRVPPAARDRLATLAAQAASGRILCFGRWLGDYGKPVDWYLDPMSGRRWNPRFHWSRALAEEPRVGDVKLTWEAARFPHAYYMARAAALDPALRPRLGQALAEQVAGFLAACPYGRGIHWVSGQEIVFRLVAWVFALRAFGPEGAVAAAAPAVARALFEGAAHVERHLDYTRKAVYNNHLVSEALGLYLAGSLLPGAPRAARWKATGLDLLAEQAGRQFYPDGAYIQQSHNYERVALQAYLWAAASRRKEGAAVPAEWTAAMERALDFLLAHQSPLDGRLPNYGANDGAQPAVLSACDFSDFRPLLQCLSLATRGERIYEPGPWDEAAAWILGPRALEAPLRRPQRRSVSFADTGYHVLRGADPSSFAAFRCGTVRDRFSQIDMLSLDVFWRGENVLADAGSYLYNGPEKWNAHFLGTACHNTVQVDGRDQMLHFRRFKTLYRTQARLLRFEADAGFALTEGQHTGYARHPGGCVHRRAVLMAGDETWVVVDQVAGSGRHRARLQWLGGSHPWRHQGGSLILDTPRGPFSVTVLAEDGGPLPGDVVAGAEDPPRGWLSRYYGEKVPAPSLAVEREGPLPLRFVTILAPGRPEVRVEAGRWTVEAGGARAAFRLEDGRFADLLVSPGSPGRRAAP